MCRIAVKATLVWLVMMLAAILNGVFREHMLNPLLGPSRALPLSGITLSFLVFLIAWISLPATGVTRRQGWLMTGFLWTALTLAFEYLFGYYLAGKSLEEINNIYGITRGNLFFLVVILLALSPWIITRIRKL